MNNESPLLSIIIPVYNVEKYLSKCLSSINPNSDGDFEIILIDDGSTDRSGAICDRYAKKYKKIFVFHKENGGLSSARNLGISVAKGKWITFIDSDDLVTEDYISLILKSILSKDDADIIMFKFKRFFDSEKLDLDKLKHHLEIKEISKSCAMAKLTTEDCGNYAWNKLYRSYLWRVIRYPDGRNFEDIATTYKVVNEAKRIYYLNNYLYLYRQRNNSITFNLKKENQTKSFEQILEFGLKQLEFFKSNNFVEAYENADHYLLANAIGFINVFIILKLPKSKTFLKAKKIVNTHDITLKKDGIKLYLQVKLFKSFPFLYKVLVYFFYK